MCILYTDGARIYKLFDDMIEGVKVWVWIVEILLIGGVLGYCFYLTALLVSSKYEIPYVPTNRVAIERVFAYIAPTPGQLLLDLGSGTGSVLCPMARRYRLRGIGYELNPFFVVITRLRAIASGLWGRVSVVHGDSRRADCSQADIIFLFVLPTFIHDETIRTHLRDTTRPGTWVVSHWYPIDYLGDRLVHSVDIGSHTTYIYTI